MSRTFRVTWLANDKMALFPKKKVSTLVGYITERMFYKYKTIVKELKIAYLNQHNQ